MAAAVRPGSPDARVPCPLCGGLLHPIAGKCKHCKADLTAYRAARPAANAPLPALNGAAGNGVAHGANGAHGQPHAPVAHAVPPPAYDAARLVLPPRPTARGQTMSSSGAWRSWPILVIVLAMLAIVAAVVLMVWPAGHDRDGKRVLQPPPAPERMDTQTPAVTPKVDPTPGQAPGAKPPQGASRDPWAPAPADPAPDPSAQAGAQADSDDEPDLDLVNPFDSSRPSPGRGRHALSLNAGGRLAIAMTAHLCRRLTDCGLNDGALSAPMRTTCEAIAHWPQTPPSSCPAAVRCLQAIDTLACTAPSDDLQLGALLTRLTDCTDAMQC